MSTVTAPIDVRHAMQEDAPRIDLARLVESHQQEIWRYLRYLGADLTETDDLVQEVFLEVTRKPFTEYSPQQSAAYLRTVARNQLLMLRRRQKREGHYVDMDVAESVWSETVWADRESENRWTDQTDALAECTQELEGRSKQVIQLQYRERCSRESIAEQLGMKPDGVKTLLRRVRQKLRDCVQRKIAAD